MSTIPVSKRRPRTEKQIDETIDDSFPASDPPSFSRTAGAGAPPRGAKLNKVEPGKSGDKNNEQSSKEDEKE